MKGRVEVVSARTGQRKAWKAPAPARVGSLSWAGDNLAFLWSPLRKVNGKTTEVRPQLRVLDTKGRGGDLRASRPLLKLPDGAEAAITSLDGRTVVTGVFANGQVSLQTYSAQTGRPAKVLWRQPVEGGKMPRLTRIARDHTGDHLIALDADGRLFVEGGRPLDAPDLGDVAW
jgi:hypothetical protein